MSIKCEFTLAVSDFETITVESKSDNMISIQTSVLKKDDFDPMHLYRDEALALAYAILGMVGRSDNE